MLEVAICDDDKEDLDKAALILDKILSEYHVQYQIRSFLSANELLNIMTRLISEYWIFPWKNWAELRSEES